MGPYPHDAPPATISDDNPMGTDGFEFVEYASTEPREAVLAVRDHGLRGGREASLEGRHALPPGRRQLRGQCRAGQLRAPVRRGARALRLRDGVPRGRREARVRARRGARRQAGRDQGRTDGAEHPGGRGHRRLAALLRRPLRRQRLDLGHRFPLERRARSEARRGRAVLRRPPDPQRLPRQHGDVGRLVRAGSSTSGRSAISTSRAR